MNNEYVAVYEEGQEKPCGAMPLESAIGLIPALHIKTGINYYTQFITPAEAKKIKRDLGITAQTNDTSLN